MERSCAQKAKCFNKRKKGEKNTVLFSLAVARKSCKSPGRSCYWRSKRLRGDLPALEKVSRKLLAPSTSCFPSSNLASKISCEPPLKQWTKKCSVWSGILWPHVYFQNMFIIFMETQHGILMQRMDDIKGKVGMLLAWMETAELTLYSPLLRRESWCWVGCNSGARALAGQRKRHPLKQCVRLQASTFTAFTHRWAIETWAESHKPELPHNKNVYQEIEPIGLATIAEQAKSEFPWHTGALFLFQHNSAIKALFPPRH